MIDTPIFDKFGVKSQIAEFAETCYPMKRFGAVKDTTAGILFLASDQVHDRLLLTIRNELMIKSSTI